MVQSNFQTKDSNAVLLGTSHSSSFRFATYDGLNGTKPLLLKAKNKTHHESIININKGRYMKTILTMFNRYLKKIFSPDYSDIWNK